VGIKGKAKCLADLSLMLPFFGYLLLVELAVRRIYAYNPFWLSLDSIFAFSSFLQVWMKRTSPSQ
jgi:hypothetical protein